MLDTRLYRRVFYWHDHLELSPDADKLLLVTMLKTLFKTDLHFDWKIVTITIVSTLAMIVDFYHQLIPNLNLDGMILYFLLPMLIIVLVFRESPTAYGFQLGDWKAGLTITLGSMLILLPLLWFVVHGDKSMQQYYIRPINLPVPLYTFFEIFGWEFLFRGWIMSGYSRRFGANALWLQAVPFALMHLKARSRNALHYFWRFHFRLDRLSHKIVSLSISDSLGDVDVCRAGGKRYVWLILRFI